MLEKKAELALSDLRFCTGAEHLIGRDAFLSNQSQHSMSESAVGEVCCSKSTTSAITAYAILDLSRSSLSSLSSYFARRLFVSS
jgi:hypothetical protein